MSGAFHPVHDPKLREEGGAGADGEQDGLLDECLGSVSVGGAGVLELRIGEDEPHEGAGGLGCLGEDGLCFSTRDEENVVGLIGFKGFLQGDVALRGGLVGRERKE